MLLDNLSIDVLIGGTVAATIQEIRAFLDAFKGTVERNGLNTWPTKKNDQFLLDSGFTSDDVEEIVRKIEV